MIKYQIDDFKNIKQAFPLLEYLENINCVCGKIKFHTKLVQQKNGCWIYEQANENEDESFYGEYSIKIDLNDCNPNPKVYETEGKIKDFAQKINKKLVDLHIYDDNTVCLDFITTKYKLNRLCLSQYIINKVYPFFAWQAYYQNFKKKPPSGEYSHGVEVDEEFTQDLENIKPNQKCLCGSGYKYKYCCKNTSFLFHRNPPPNPRRLK